MATTAGEGVEEEEGEGTTAEGADDDSRLLESLGCEFSFFKKIGAEAFFAQTDKIQNRTHL